MDELRNKIIDKLNLIEDEKVMLALDSIIENLKTSNFRKLTDGEKKIIAMGMEDFDRGRTISDEDLRHEEEKWLRE